jgi:hypothetical protein
MTYILQDWQKIHPDFGEKDWQSNKTYQKLWEENNFAYEEARQWINIGFVPFDHKKAKFWKDYGFTLQQTKPWIEKGLKSEDYEFASYLKQNNYQSNNLTETELTKLKKEHQQTQTYLDFWYPEEGMCIRKTEYTNNFDKTREQITELWISDLSGSLKLEGFVNLERLDCANNQLTNLDLSDCGNLKLLWCWGNQQLPNLDFLNTLKNSEKLVKICISNNNFSKSDLTPFSKFVNLEELDLGNNNNNNFTGSLEPLAGLVKLKTLSINSTDIDSGLEYLPESVEDFSCSGVKVIEEEINKSGGKLSFWRVAYQKAKEAEERLRQAEEKRIITLLIPVEKLSTAQRDIKKFLEKWNKEKLDKLRDKQQLAKYRWTISSVQWTGRVASVVGGALLLNGYTNVGGVVGIVCPFVEVVSSQLEKNLYEEKRKKWEEFTQSTDKLWDTYWELDDMLKVIKEEAIKGEVKEILRGLKEKINGFLKEYDTDGNNKIEAEEREIARKKIAQDIKDNWVTKKKQLREIERTTESLCKEVIGYRDNNKVISQIEHSVIDLDQHFEQKELEQVPVSSQTNLLDKSQEIELQNLASEQQTQIVQTEPFGMPSSSKPPK